MENVDLVKNRLSSTLIMDVHVHVHQPLMHNTAEEISNPYSLSSTLASMIPLSSTVTFDIVRVCLFPSSLVVVWNLSSSVEISSPDRNHFTVRGFDRTRSSGRVSDSVTSMPISGVTMEQGFSVYTHTGNFVCAVNALITEAEHFCGACHMQQVMFPMWDFWYQRQRPPRLCPCELLKGCYTNALVHTYMHKYMHLHIYIQSYAHTHT